MFEHIMVPLDGSSLAESVLPHVVAVAAAFDAQVTLLQVVECDGAHNDTMPIDPLHWQMRKAETQAYLNRWVEQLRDANIRAEAALLEGQPARRIIGFVREQKVDLIILCSHGASGVSGWNIGSMAQKILQRAYVSTMIVRAYRTVPATLTELHYQRILTPLDGSQRSDYALGLANRLAEYHHSRLIMAHVITKPELFQRMPPQPELLDLAERLTEYNRREAITYLEQMQGRANSDVAIRVLTGDEAALRLHQLADDEDADLIVMSAHGHSGRAKWPFGNVTTNMLLYGAAPILMVQDFAMDQIEPTFAERFAEEQALHA